MISMNISFKSDKKQKKYMLVLDVRKAVYFFTEAINFSLHNQIVLRIYRYM